MQAPRATVQRSRAALRVGLSHYIANGLSVALGLFLISAGVHAWLGTLAAASAAVGVIVTAPPDLPGPRRVLYGCVVRDDCMVRLRSAATVDRSAPVPPLK